MSRVVKQEALEGGETVRHFGDVQVAADKPGKLGQQDQRLIDDALHDSLEFCRMSRGQGDACSSVAVC